MTAMFAVTAVGLDVIEQRLAALLKGFGNLKPLMERFGIVLETSTLGRFETETDPEGVKWKPSFRARVSGGKTLTDSGQLKLSITTAASSDKVEIGTNKIYAGVHQFGATIKAKNGARLRFRLPGLGWRSPAQVIIPKRSFLGLSADDREELDAQMTDYVAELAPEVER